MSFVFLIFLYLSAATAGYARLFPLRFDATTPCDSSAGAIGALPSFLLRTVSVSTRLTHVINLTICLSGGPPAWLLLMEICCAHTRGLSFSELCRSPAPYVLFIRSGVPATCSESFARSSTMLRREPNTCWFTPSHSHDIVAYLYTSLLQLKGSHAGYFLMSHISTYIDSYHLYLVGFCCVPGHLF